MRRRLAASPCPIPRRLRRPRALRRRRPGARRRGDGQAAQLEQRLEVDAGPTGRGRQRPWLAHAPSWLGRLAIRRRRSGSPTRSAWGTRPAFAAPAPSLPWKGMTSWARRRRASGSAMFPIEGDRGMPASPGVLHDHPPDDHEGFLAFAKSLPADEMHRAIEGLEPISPIATYEAPRTSGGTTRPVRCQRSPTGSSCSARRSAAATRSRAGHDHLRPRRGAAAPARACASSGGSTATIPGLSAASRRRRQGDRRPLDDDHGRGRSVLPEVEGERPPGYSMMKWYSAA